MAKSFILRPSADISGGDGTSYLKINDIVADDDETCLGVDASGDRGGQDYDDTATYVFSLSGNIPLNRIKVTDIKIIYRISMYDPPAYGGASFTIILTKENKEFFYNLIDKADSEEFVTFNETVQAEWINSVISSPLEFLSKIQMKIRLRAYHQYNEGMSKGDGGKVFITQAYIEVLYDDVENVGIYDKINGKQKAATATYQKVNGKWTDIPEDEVKTILKNNTIQRG